MILHRAKEPKRREDERGWFMNLGVDGEFGECVDGSVVVDSLKPKRYKKSNIWEKIVCKSIGKRHIEP